MLVSGGLGGLGLIASMQCANEFQAPIITTSRSGRVPTGNAMAYQLFEALQEKTAVYCVKCDVGTSKELHDMLACIGMGAMPMKAQLATLSDIDTALRKQYIDMPDSVLRALLDVLYTIKTSIGAGISDLSGKENTKIDRAMLAELQLFDKRFRTNIELVQAKLELGRDSGADPGSLRSREAAWDGLLSAIQNLKAQVRA